jgi:prolyl-tRNA synthetase
VRFSQLLTTTLREAPRDVEERSHELLLRAGFIRQLTAGIYSYLPLGNRVLHNIMQIVREEMERIGGQEVTLPMLQPEEIWDQHPASGGSSRLEQYGPVLFRLQDRKERAMVIAPTHEEAVALVAKEFLRSYRDLPQLLYQFQVKLRDEPRPRGGLLRAREFLMKDLYSFDADQAGLDRSFARVKAAYRAIFWRCELAFLDVEADSGAVGGKESLEFVALTEAGEDTVLKCVKCDYAANQEKAEFVRTALPVEPELPLEEVYTPGCMAISDLAQFLNVPEAKTMKAVCYVASGRMVLVVVRGDLEVNEVKLSNTLNRAGVNATDLHLATPEELTREGIVAGYTSPLQKDEHILIIADTSLQQGNNFVAGANRIDYHVQHVNYPRDFRVDIWADIASAYDHATCVHCGGTLHAFRGCELGHVFKIGTRYAELFDVTYLDAEGNAHPVQMGSYGIGIGRLMALIVEQQHDEKGMIWPLELAPYQIALLGLDLDKTSSVAEQLYTDLTAAGLSVLFDDRAETAGVKFNDADLIGLPLRVVVSKRSLKNGGVELKWRARRESRIVPVEDAVQAIQAEIRNGL